MTTPPMTVDEALAALTQLITYSNKLARHTRADVALDTLRVALAERDAEIDALRAALQRVVWAYEDTNVEFGWKARADAIDAARAELEGGK